MATAIASVTLNTSTYTALASSKTTVRLFLQRGQTVRVASGSSPSGTDFVVLEGPANVNDTTMKSYDFTLSGADLYALLIGDHSVTNVRVLST